MYSCQRDTEKAHPSVDRVFGVIVRVWLVRDCKKKRSKEKRRIFHVCMGHPYSNNWDGSLHLWQGHQRNKFCQFWCFMWRGFHKESSKGLFPLGSCYGHYNIPWRCCIAALAYKANSILWGGLQTLISRKPLNQSSWNFKGFFGSQTTLLATGQIQIRS